MSAISRTLDRTRLAGPLPRDLALADRDALLVMAQSADVEIARAYWSFTRSARGVPPPVAVPGAYAVRAWVGEAMRRRGCGS